MYSSEKNLALVPNIAVGASETNTVVSKEFRITQAGSKHIRVMVTAYNVTSAAGITFKMQHLAGESEGKFSFEDADVTAATNLIAETAHGLSTGDTCTLTTTGTLPAGLATSTLYYIIRNGANDIKLALSAELATAGTAVDITAAAGGGVHTVNYKAKRWVTVAKTGTTINANADFYFLLKAEVAGDQADLPLMPLGRVVVTTGGGDAVTIGTVRVIQGE